MTQIPNTLLERLEPKILNEVFGYINSFTEHDKLKVIILCNETEIKNKIPDYIRIKEKLIRFTFNFVSDIEKVFTNFSKIYEKKYSDFLNNKKDFIVQLYIKGNHKNLRTLKFNLDIFEKIFESVVNNNNIQDTYIDAILDRFLFFTTTYSIEYKKGESEKSLSQLQRIDGDSKFNIGGIDINHLMSNMNKNHEADKGPKEYYELFSDIYIPYNSTPFSYYDAIASYIHTGLFNNTELIVKAKELEDTIKTRETKPAYQSLQRFNNIVSLEDNEFESVKNDIILSVKNGEYDIITYPQIFHHLMQIETAKINNFNITDEIISAFGEGIEKSKIISRYINSFESRFQNFTVYDDRYESIKKLATNANKSLKDNKIISISINFKKILDKNDGVFQFLSSDEFKYDPFFSFLDANDIFNSLIKSPNLTKDDFTKGIEARYLTSYLFDQNPQELAFLIDLSTITEKYLLSATNTISTLIFKDLIEILDKAIHNPKSI